MLWEWIGIFGSEKSEFVSKLKSAPFSFACRLTNFHSNAFAERIASHSNWTLTIKMAPTATPKTVEDSYYRRNDYFMRDNQEVLHIGVGVCVCSAKSSIRVPFSHSLYTKLSSLRSWFFSFCSFSSISGWWLWWYWLTNMCIRSL